VHDEAGGASGFGGDGADRQVLDALAGQDAPDRLRDPLLLRLVVRSACDGPLPSLS
jgi:hypothetical protein